MQRTATQKTYKLLLANLYAAAWVQRLADHQDDRTLLSKFFQLHEFFLGAMNRPRPGLFDHVPPQYMADLIRGWMKMYAAALADLQQQHPRTNNTDDLHANGVNWSQKLQTSLDGLLRISSPSRYAEFWAERSIKDHTIRQSFQPRLRFIGTQPYHAIATLVRENQLLILDQGPNAIPSYDLLQTVQSATPQQQQNLHTLFTQHGWHPHTLTPLAQSTLITLAQAN